MKKSTIVLSASLLIIGCGSPDKQAQLEKLRSQQSEIAEQIKILEQELAASDTTKQEMKFKMVAVTAVNPKYFNHSIDIQGRVEADQNITMSSNMGGVVSKILVKAGDEVKNGQLLAQLDNQMIVKGIDELKTGLAFATDVYNKQKNLWDQKIGSEIQYLNAKNTKEGLEKKLASLNEQLDLAKLEAPIDGTVDEVMLKVGQVTAPGYPAIRIVNLSKMKAKADVSETYSSKIKQGNDVIVYFPDIKKEVQATINYSGRVINPTTRTFGVEIILEANDADYHPNMIAVLKIVDYKSDSAMVVPINTVQNSDEGEYVFVSAKENGVDVAKKRLVKVGYSYNGLVEIKSGLNKGDMLITTGYQDLNDGEVVKF